MYAYTVVDIAIKSISGHRKDFYLKRPFLFLLAHHPLYLSTTP